MDVTKFICKHCNKSFSRKNNWVRHLLAHTDQKKYRCELCNNEFKCQYNLKRHISIHAQEKQFNCEVCKKAFRCKFNLKKHTQRFHSGSGNFFKCEKCSKIFKTEISFKSHVSCENGLRKECKKKFKKCSICDFKGSKKDVLNHFKCSHEIHFSYQHHAFQNENEFQEWKDSVETNGNQTFLIKVNKKRKDGSIRRVFKCHRDGNFISKSSNKRKLKMLGSNKINGYCPAQMVVISEVGDNISVRFQETHVGHILDIRRIRSKKSRESLAHKISFDNILDEVRESKRDKNDFISVHSWVLKMNKISDFIRLYKPQGELLPLYPKLKEEDFILIIANNAQLEYLSIYGNDCVCVDETQEMNSHNFSLITIMVLDDLRQALPCGFMFSNRRDPRTIEIFYTIIKINLTSPIVPRIFISNMAELFFNTWEAIFPNNQTLHLFCSWHIDQAWRKNLRQVKDSLQRLEVYKLLRTLLEETDEEAFERMLPTAINNFKNNPCTETFGHYFDKYYHSTTKAWAFCYRKHTGLNSNIYLEKMHRSIKYFYLLGKRANRLDKSLYELMHFLKNLSSNRPITINKGRLTPKLSEIRKRHISSLKMDTAQIHRGNESWRVISKNLNEVYDIREQKHDCDCKLICNDCRVCVHAYACSCNDNSIKWNMCKHIHLLCQFLDKSTSPPQTNEDISTDEPLVIVVNQPSPESSIINLEQNNPDTISEKLKQDVIEQFISTINSAESSEHLNLLLKSIVSAKTKIEASITLGSNNETKKN